MGNFRIAVPTNGSDCLDDIVSNVFGRAKTFTIVDVENQQMIDAKVIENSAESYNHGAGPIVVKMLVDEGVNVVLSNKLGIGASELLKQFNITHFQVTPGKNVKETIEKALPSLKMEASVK